MRNPLPEELFVIVTKDAGAIAQWNLNLGRIGSAGAAFAEQDGTTYAEQRDEWLPWLPNPAYETFASFHMMRITSDMRMEYNAELARIRGFRAMPSRFACLFAWGSLEDALLAREKMSGRFKGEIKRCRPVVTLRWARCNSALVNFAQRAERRGFFTDQTTVDTTWHTYWSGSGKRLALERQNILDLPGPPETIEMSQTPLWEWLIDGTLDVIEDVTPKHAEKCPKTAVPEPRKK